jgi:hypothetical protein
MKSNPKAEELTQDERLGEGDEFEDEDKKRIDETVKRLQDNQAKIQRIQRMKYGEEEEMAEEPVETLEQVFIREYQALVADIKTVRRVAYPKISHDIPILDVTIKLIFDEDLKMMLFPKVQEFEFRANSDSPVELCAKILAI